MKAGIELGFDERVSENIVSHTFSNAIQMSNFSQTVSAVATKGGATQRGLECFIQGHLNEIISAAIQNAYSEVDNFK